MPQYIADRGIRTAPFHIRVDELSTSPTNGTPSLILEATESGTSDAPIMQLQRITSSPSDSDDLGRIQFIGNNSAGEDISYATIHAESKDVSDGTEDGQIIFSYRNAGSLETAMQLGRDEIVFNEGSNDTNFRVESDDQTHMLFVDAGNNRININSSTDEGGIVNIITTDNSPNLVLACRDTDASTGPVLELDRDIATSDVSAGDLIGEIRFSSGVNQYAEIQTKVLDPTVGSKDGEMNISIESNDTMSSALRLGATEAVFNDDSNNIDFRIESDGQANMFFVDAANDFIGIRRNDPAVTLDVVGAGRFSNGIFFGTDDASPSSPVTSNKLDDYEEGTFTPNATFTSTPPSNGTVNGTGIYTKVGRIVTIDLNVTNIHSTGASGDLRINGLPFAADLIPSPGLYVGTVRLSAANLADTGDGSYCVAEVPDNSSYVRIGEISDGASAVDLINTGNISNDVSDIFVHLQYIAT